MAISVKPSGQACGAEVTGIDLSKPISADEIAQIRAAWAEHHVLSFPSQNLSDDDLERFTTYFGSLNDDPFFRPIDGRKYVAAIERRADETAPIFAESWHADWSFKTIPPLGTCLYGKIIPPEGGDTLFANQHMAFDALSSERKAELEKLRVVHSAAPAYAPEGIYGQESSDIGRSMKPIISEEARATQIHNLIKVNPDNGRKAIYGCFGYTVGVDGLSQEEGMKLLTDLHGWQVQPEFIYTHKWKPNMLVMWDNRSVLHRASGGYDGYERLLHRTTIWQKTAA